MASGVAVGPDVQDMFDALKMGKGKDTGPLKQDPPPNHPRPRAVLRCMRVPPSVRAPVRVLGGRRSNEDRVARQT